MPRAGDAVDGGRCLVHGLACVQRSPVQAILAERKMQGVIRQIAAEAQDRWGIGRVAVQHRTGELAIGEISVVVAVSAPHRAEAFSACRYIIDELKSRAPIWKKEFGVDGEVWVGEQSRPTAPEQ